MKAISFFCPFTLLLSIILLTNCSKDETPDTFDIEYPDSGFYGVNFLNYHDTIFNYDYGGSYGDGFYHSMKAILYSMDNKLKIEIKGTRVTVYSSSGWLYEPFNRTFDNYVFYTEGSISADLRIHLDSEEDKNALINIYENDDVLPTRTKKIRLEN